MFANSPGRCWLTVVALAILMPHMAPGDPIDIGSRRELLVDDFLIEKMQGVELRLQKPIPREVVIVHDQPWEGNICAYHTVFQDGDLYRMYYRGGHFDESQQKQTREQVYCYAESIDGIHWTKPKLGLIEFAGSKDNNIIIRGDGSHNFAPFKDENPDCKPDAQYKAVGSGKGGLLAFKSPDGVAWSLIRDEPVITDGAFDSLNLAFWDSSRSRYVDFHRDLRDGVRDIKTCTSTDFVNWTAPEWIEYANSPPEHLYTNAITPYRRAPHLFMGFPKRFLPDRNPIGHRDPGVSDGVFMTTRDGIHFNRWNEAFLRPGPQPDRWVNRNNLMAWGMVVTKSDQPGAPDELSIYSTEGYYRGDAVRLRRFTVRMDGFVSAYAGAAVGEFITKPLVFAPAKIAAPPAGTGDVWLSINYATSAAGSVRCEIQDVNGQPLPGYALDECDEVVGDQLEKAISWLGHSELKPVEGQPVRLRFVLRDADLYSFQFQGQ